MVPLFHAVVKFCSTNILFMDFEVVMILAAILTLLHIQSTSHNSDHTGQADFVRITENPVYVETSSVLHFNSKLIGLSNSVRNMQKSG